MRNRVFTSVFEVEVNEVLRDFKDRQFMEPLCSFYITDNSLNEAVDKGKASKYKARLTSTQRY